MSVTDGRDVWPLAGHLLAALVVAGCGPTAGASGEAGATTSGSTGDSGTTTGMGTSSGQTDGGPDLGSPPELCETGAGARAAWSLEGLGVSGLTTDCVVEGLAVEPGVGEEPPEVILDLPCDDGVTLQDVVLTMRSSGFAPPPVAEGDVVSVTVWVECPFWCDYWFTVRDPEQDGALLLAGVEGSAATPAGEQTTFLAPLEVEHGDAGCPPVEDDCGLAVPQMMTIEHGGDEVEVVAGHTAQVGPPASRYNVELEIAERYPEPGCVDQPPAWWRMLVTRIEG